MGVSALIGVAFIPVFGVVQYKVTAILARLKNLTLKTSDTRLKKINELLQGMKLLKLCAWEEIFCSSVEKVREQQVKLMMKSGAYMIVGLSTAKTVTAMVTLISFVSYSLLNPDPLTPELAFVALSFFGQMAVPISVFTLSLRSTAEAIPSMRRIQTFCEAHEIGDAVTGLPPMTRGFEDVDIDEQIVEDCDDVVNNDQGTVLDSSEVSGTYGRNRSKRDILASKTAGQSDSTSLLKSDYNSAYGTFTPDSSVIETTLKESDVPEDIALQITDGAFSWNPDGSEDVLNNINIQICVGSLVMVIGLVGSGKSSLLSAILGEMTTTSGMVQFNRKKNSVSYVPQKPWIQNATLRDNILFGEMFNHERYSAVIAACALQPDIDILPAGDMTEIGERGINLSGGQKQRISMARAMYRKTDTLLLDDPLSALDVHVGSHLVENGIMDMLVREGKTVILATHQLQYLHFANKVVLMDDGKVSKEGNLKEIQLHDPDLFAAWQETLRVLSESERDSESDDERLLSAEDERLEFRQRVCSKEIQEKLSRNANGFVGALIEKEERLTGSVSWRVYRTYAKAVKYPLVALIFSLLAAQVSFYAASSFWLSTWSEAGVDIGNKTKGELDEESRYYRIGYTALTVSFVGFVVALYAAEIMFSILAANRIHLALLRNIIHAPMRFFDTTPIGRILNRFSYDTEDIDQKLWFAIINVLDVAASSLAGLVVNAIVTPVFIVAVAPLFVVYFLIQKYYLATTRELQRLDNITRSPIFAHFTETLGGLPIIRAYRDERRFRKRIQQTIDSNATARLYFFSSFHWSAIRLDLLSSSVVLISGLGSLISCVQGLIQPSWVGLALNYALGMCGELKWMLRKFAECETSMNALERVEHYTNIQPEEYRGTYTPSPGWPDKGNIRFEDVSVRYAADQEPVLKDVNVNFRAGEKIGICGRTGSGKSSLTLALFRIIDTFKGRIVIDGIDISRVPLLTLRERLVIIPQDPVLFAGTIRFNLDPQYKKTDDEIWEALAVAQLKGIVSKLDNRLDSDVSEEGDNFSVGQRQLFGLARAFLRNAKIVVMDEATTSIDVKTDAILQSVISTAFTDMTVLTIAHRISTVLDSDSVLVLSEGKAVEFDSPKKLQNQDGSEFGLLVKKR
ncbi:ATP-binding cassette sub-family C member 9-like [Ptychodera flava]|uniref:ATP-binding cassette sub-family C member 9-like n=1 Tax=Ptychodera flava TaxID=63121 RepID=UPI003969C26A